ncbi:LuxR C-terminal-related transcriptional regulator [Ruania zhangjianzhongii]|uniref:LuxR C-terminal-related transcriptional regulator n=1 Tax=Ruania zhangjianzhongii TaxID=2603206 RepID=UPI0011C8103C|nr:LuxR C-terminal-related transcriptional regulator [Ruania zhangjianzhongii]
MDGNGSRAWPPSQLTLTSFVGREAEVDGVARLLGEARLVTVVGPPGAGKTRLAVEIARRTETATERGVVSVPLAAVSDSADLVSEIAVALEVPTDRGATLTEAVLEALRDADLLLLLDNCEHVREEAATLVSRIVTTCPRVRVLATSRVPLAVPGEQLHRIGPLDASAAAQLFTDRAALVTTLVPEAGTAAVIDEICARLDGLPLAIELVARQTRVLSLPELLARLASELAGAQLPHPTAAGHWTLTATIGWSCEQLSPAQQRLFEALSVLVGAFDLPAVAAVAADHPKLVANLARLVDHSLLLAEPADGGELRYRLLEPIRQYAAARLEATTRGEQVRAAHAQHFLEVARSASLGLMGVAGHRQYSRLRDVEGNVLAAVTWARAGHGDLAVQLVTCLAGYWEHRGHVNAARERIEPLLVAPGLSPRTRAEALLALAQLGYRQGRYREAITQSADAVELMRTLGDDDGQARGLRALAQVAAAAGDSRRAVSCCQRSIALFADLGDRQAEAWSHTVLAYAHFTLDEIDQGAEADLAALRLLASAEPAPAIARRTRVGLSYAAARRGDLAAHRKYLAGAIADLQLLGAADGDSEWLWSGVSLAHSEGRTPAVLRLAGAAQALARHGTAVPPVVAAIVTAAVEDAERKVGVPVAEKLRSAGAAMTTEQAISAALGLPDRSRPALSEREHEVAMLTGKGLTNTEIAEQLVISRRTVETHQEHIRTKLAVSSRQGVIAWAITGESV